MSRLATGTVVELGFDEGRSDRYGRLLAQVFVVSGEARRWLQEELIAQGLGRVYSFPGG